MNKKMLVILIFTATLPLWAANDAKDYPLRLQIVTTSQVRRADRTIFVQGKATLLDPSENASSALSYSGTCLFTFQASPTAAMLMNPAKWKKQGSKLSVLWHKIGNNEKTDKCDLDVYEVLPHKAYVAGGGRLQLVTQEQLISQIHIAEALQRDQHPVDSDPAHYPLRVLFLAASWQEEPYGFSGRGKGNVYEGSQANAIDFTATCPTRPSGGFANYYPAQWAGGNSRLLLLAHPVGEEGKAYQCELTIDRQPFVYVRNRDTGIVSDMTQDEYKNWVSDRKAELSPAQSDQTAVGLQKLSVNSIPESADIEVDGTFVGSTPSVVELKTGEHNIVVRKPGYKPWQRKLNLATGEIRVNAELEKDGSSQQ